MPFTVKVIVFDNKAGIKAPKVIEAHVPVVDIVGGLIKDAVTPIVTSSVDRGTAPPLQFVPVFQSVLRPSHALVAASNCCVCKQNNTSKDVKQRDKVFINTR